VRHDEYKHPYLSVVYASLLRFCSVDQAHEWPGLPGYFEIMVFGIAHASQQDWILVVAIQRKLPRLRHVRHPSSVQAFLERIATPK
jgi:hypothetical protein